MSARHLVLLLASLLAVTSCNQLPQRHGEDVVTTKSSSLEQAGPIEVALAPIVNNSGNKALPSNMLRNSCQQGLVKRRYSPLALELVDKQVVNASYKAGALQEEAVFTLAIERWETRLWETRNVLEVTLTGRMTDSAKSGAELWSGRLERRFDFTDVAEKFVTADALQRHACETITAELLAALPVRQSSPGSH